METTGQIIKISQKAPLAKKELEAYEWFNNKNKEGALKACEASAHAAFNGIQKQAELYEKDALAFYNKDRAEKTVVISRQLGFKTKLFAVHESDGFEEFEVKSTKWDWKVMPIEISEERTPTMVLERLTLLSSYGVSFDNFAIAVPYKANYKPTTHVLKTETINTVNSITKPFTETAKKSSKGLRKIAPLAAAVWAAFLRDPVLLGCYGIKPMFLIEIGRWA